MIENKRFYLGLFGILLFGAVLAIGIQQAKAAPPAPKVVASEEFQNWKYQVVQEPDGSFTAWVDHSQDSIEALQRYAALQGSLVQSLQDAGVGELSMSVTFRHPISVEVFRQWATTHSMDVKAFTLRVKNPNGESVTVGGAPTNGEIVEDEHLKRILEHVAEYGATDVQGIFAVDGSVSIDAYEGIKADKQVFLADVTRSVVLSKLKQIDPGVLLQPESILAEPIFPRMEALGIDKFQ